MYIYDLTIIFNNNPNIILIVYDDGTSIIFTGVNHAQLKNTIDNT